MRKAFQLTALMLALTLTVSGCNFFESPSQRAERQANEAAQNAESASTDKTDAQTADTAKESTDAAKDSTAADSGKTAEAEATTTKEDAKTTSNAFAVSDDQWDALAAKYNTLKTDYDTLNTYFNSGNSQGELVLSELLTEVSTFIETAGALKHSELNPDDYDTVSGTFDELDSAVNTAIDQYYADVDLPSDASQSEERQPLVKNPNKTDAPANN